jgi:molybdopterin/thiamine biosynthesis adenylyltransferase
MNDLVRSIEYPRYPEGPGQLRDSSVIVVGVGGLGTEVARLLAQAGVGRLVLCDPDVVESSNLSRGALYGPEHVGMPKVAAAGQALHALAPQTVVDARQDDFRYGVGLGELRTAGLVVSCLDSVTDRIVLSSRCMFSGNPRGMLDAGLHPWGGEVRHYTPAGPCYACGCRPADRSLPAWHVTCRLPEEMGASGPVTTLVASWQAVCAVRLLSEEPVPDSIFRIEAPTGQSRLVLHPRDPDCLCHQTIPPRDITMTPLTHRSRVAELLALAGDGEHVLSWNPVDRGDPLSPLTLRAATPEAQLQDLGIPPAEILPVVRVRPVRHVRYLALQEVP